MNVPDDDHAKVPHVHPAEPEGPARPAGEPLEVKRRRLRFQAVHRGTKETDLLVGGFAEAAIGGLDAAGLEEFERLLQQNDVDLYTWKTGGEALPDDLDGPVMRAFLAHRFTRPVAS